MSTASQPATYVHVVMILAFHNQHRIAISIYLFWDDNYYSIYIYYSARGNEIQASSHVSIIIIPFKDTIVCGYLI